MKADRERKAGRWLALVPVGIGVVLLALMMPRATLADTIPVPRADHRVTDAIARTEDALAREAEEERLPTDVLAVGSAVRDLNEAEATDDPTSAHTRALVETTVTEVMRRKGVEDLVKLRAVQARRFLAAIEEWERGAEPADFSATGARLFVRRAEAVGWVRDKRILLDPTQRRVAFKTVWNAMTHLDTVPSLAIALDEERALYAFYLQHPRPPENARDLVASRIASATTPEACARAKKEKRRQEEMWRADKIKRLGAIDPTYPTDYALGVAYARAGRSDLAVDAFGTFLQAHPDGPYALRARNHLKAALAGDEP